MRELLSPERGGCRWRDAEALETAIGELLADENRREELGRNALQVVRENLGAVDRTVEMILENLKGARDLYRARKIDSS